MSRSSTRVIFQCDGGGPDDDETSDEDTSVDEEEDEEETTEETTEDESDENEESNNSKPPAQPRSTRQSNPSLKPAVGGGSRGRVTRQQARDQLPAKRLLRSRKKSPVAGSNLRRQNSTPEIVCRKCKRKFGTKQALGLHTHWCQNQSQSDKKPLEETGKKRKSDKTEDTEPEPEVKKRPRGRPRKSNPPPEEVTPVATTSQTRKRSQNVFEEDAQSQPEMDFGQSRSPQSSPGLVDTSSESEYEQREFAANVHQLIQNRSHSVSIDVVNPDPEEEEGNEMIHENEEIKMPPQEGPVTCSQCKMTYRTVQGFQNHWGSCMAYSSDTEEDEDEEVDVVQDDPTPIVTQREPEPVLMDIPSAAPEDDTASTSTTTSEEGPEPEPQVNCHRVAVEVPNESHITPKMPLAAASLPPEIEITPIPPPAPVQARPIQKVELSIQKLEQPISRIPIQTIQIPPPAPPPIPVIKSVTKSPIVVQNASSQPQPQLQSAPVVINSLPNVIPAFTPHQPHLSMQRFPQNEVSTVQPTPVPVQVQNNLIYNRAHVPVIPSGSSITAPILQQSNNTPTYTQAQLMPGTVLHNSMMPNPQTSSSSSETTYNPVPVQTQPQVSSQLQPQPQQSITQQFPTIVFDPVTQQHVLRFPQPQQPTQLPAPVASNPPQANVYAPQMIPQVPQMFRAPAIAQAQPQAQPQSQQSQVPQSQYPPSMPLQMQAQYPGYSGAFPPQQYPQVQVQGHAHQQHPHHQPTSFPIPNNSQHVPSQNNSQLIDQNAHQQQQPTQSPQIQMGLDPNAPYHHHHPQLPNGTPFQYAYPGSGPQPQPHPQKSLQETPPQMPSQIFNAAQNILPTMGNPPASQITPYIPNLNLGQSQNQASQQQQHQQTVPYHSLQQVPGQSHPHPQQVLPHLPNQHQPQQNFFQNPNAAVQQNTYPGTGHPPYPPAPSHQQPHPQSQLQPNQLNLQLQRPQHPQQPQQVHQFYGDNKEQQTPQVQAPASLNLSQILNPAFQQQQQQQQQQTWNNKCVVQPSNSQPQQPEGDQSQQQTQSQQQAIQQIAQFTDAAGNTTVIIMSPAQPPGGNALGAGVLNLIPGLQNVVQVNNQSQQQNNGALQGQCYHSLQNQGQGRSGPCPCPNCKDKQTTAAASHSPLPMEKYKKVLPYPGTLTSPNSELRRISPRPDQVKASGSKQSKTIRIQKNTTGVILQQPQNMAPLQQLPQLQGSPLKVVPVPLAIKTASPTSQPQPSNSAVMPTTGAVGVVIDQGARGSTNTPLSLPNSNVAVVRPMENPLQKISDQISQIGSSFVPTPPQHLPQQQHPLLQNQNQSPIPANVAPSQNYTLPLPLPQGPHLTLVTVSPPPQLTEVPAGMTSPSGAVTLATAATNSPQPRLMLVDHGSPTTRLQSPNTNRALVPIKTVAKQACPAGTRTAAVKRKLTTTTPTTTPSTTTTNTPAESSAGSESGSESDMIKIVLSQKDGIKDFSGIKGFGNSQAKTNCLKINRRTKAGDVAVSSSTVVVTPRIHLVPIPVVDDDDPEGNCTIGENGIGRNSNVSNNGTNDGKKLGKTMNHMAVVVYEFHDDNNSEVLFRTSDVNSAWDFIFQSKGTRMANNLPRICYPPAKINCAYNNKSAAGQVDTKLNMSVKAVKFLMNQFFRRKTDISSVEMKPPEPRMVTLSDDEDVILENESGCARTERYLMRKDFDMFGWLTSKHRQKLPPANSNGSIETSLGLNSIVSRKQKHKLKELQERASKSLIVWCSPIHGRGLFTRRKIEEGEWVIEYAGELIRPIVCDMREKYYEFKSVGCYMFRIDDNMIIDATMRGNAARFINHSCEPNCQAKVEKVYGKVHIIISALRQIQIGEELTYDYKFEKEEEKIPCTCGSKHCRKYLN